MAPDVNRIYWHPKCSELVREGCWVRPPPPKPYSLCLLPKFFSISSDSPRDASVRCFSSMLPLREATIAGGCRYCSFELIRSSNPAQFADKCFPRFLKTFKSTGAYGSRNWTMIICQKKKRIRKAHRALDLFDFEFAWRARILALRLVCLHRVYTLKKYSPKSLVILFGRRGMVYIWLVCFKVFEFSLNFKNWFRRD